MPSGKAGVDIGFGSTEAQYRVLRTRLKEAEREIRLEFMAKVRALLKPLGELISESAMDRLPKHGGLAERVARSKYAVRNRPLSVIFQTVNPYEIKDIDNGEIRHPVFGHLDRWVPQHVSPGFWSDPVEKFKPEVTAALEVQMQETMNKIGR